MTVALSLIRAGIRLNVTTWGRMTSRFILDAAQGRHVCWLCRGGDGNSADEPACSLPNDRLNDNDEKYGEYRACRWAYKTASLAERHPV